MNELSLEEYRRIQQEREMEKEMKIFELGFLSGVAVALAAVWAAFTITQ